MISSGNTYEQDAITRHFESVGFFDPITNEEVDKNFIRENKNLKASVDQFLKDNP